MMPPVDFQPRPEKVIFRTNLLTNIFGKILSQFTFYKHFIDACSHADLGYKLRILARTLIKYIMGIPGVITTRIKKLTYDITWELVLIIMLILVTKTFL